MCCSAGLRAAASSPFPRLPRPGLSPRKTPLATFPAQHMPFPEQEHGSGNWIVNPLTSMRTRFETRKSATYEVGHNHPMAFRLGVTHLNLPERAHEMTTTFIGFSARQQGTLRQDIILAGQLAMRAVNSMLLTLSGRPSEQTARLLWWVFTVEPNSTVWDNVDPIKNVYLGFTPRFDTLSVNHDASPPALNTIEFDAYVRQGHRDRVFIRDNYFAKTPRDRALTLILRNGSFALRRQHRRRTSRRTDHHVRTCEYQHHLCQCDPQSILLPILCRLDLGAMTEGEWDAGFRVEPREPIAPMTGKKHGWLFSPGRATLSIGRWHPTAPVALSNRPHGGHIVSSRVARRYPGRAHPGPR